MLKEAISSISENFRERASSPLLGSYTAAALAFNWKPVVILLTSTETGTKLVAETVVHYPGSIQGVLYPLVFAILFSLIYPTTKAFIGAINTQAKIIELRSEYKLQEWRDRVFLKKNDIQSIIDSLSELSNMDKIGYHDLKRIHDILPRPSDLEIKQADPQIKQG